jgi:hypothetical protein
MKGTIGSKALALLKPQAAFCPSSTTLDLIMLLAVECRGTVELRDL